jgi:general secretion pathway protein F
MLQTIRWEIMAVFTYKATDRGGKKVEGRMEAQDAGAVAARLQELNFFPLGISRQKEGAGEKGFGFRPLSRVRGRVLIHFTQQLALLLSSGLPLDRSLAISGELVQSASFGSVVEKVQRSVEEGSTFADALARHPRHFSSLYVSMVRAGEASGTLDTILTRLAEFLEEWQRFRDVIVTALTYPAFLAFFAVAAVGVLMGFVVPKFGAAFADMTESIPAPTRVLIAFSEAFRAYWWVFAVASALAAVAAAAFFRSRRGREWWDRKVLGLPVLGGLVVRVQVSRFSRVLGTLIQGGVPILKALEIVTDTLTNTVFSRSVTRVQTGLKEGQGIAEPLRKAGVFPPLFLHMVTVGEETGKLEDMLLTIAATFDREIERGAKRLLSIFEPIIILVMGIAIGSIILSILWAIFSVNQMAF